MEKKFYNSVNNVNDTFDLINYPYYNSYFNNIDPLVDNALNSYRYFNYDVALENIEKFLSKNPANAKVWSFKAYILYKLEFYEDALYCCDVSLNIDDLFEFTWLTKAFVLIMLKHKNDALLCFDEYLVSRIERLYIDRNCHRYYYYSGNKCTSFDSTHPLRN